MHKPKTKKCKDCKGNGMLAVHLVCPKCRGLGYYKVKRTK